MEDLVKIFGTADEVEMQMVANLLTDSGITCVKKDEGSGEYMRLYMGTSFYTKEIYVDKQDYERAKEIIDNYQGTVAEEEEEKDEKETQPSDYKRKIMQKRIIALLILMIMFGLPILLMIIVFIFSNLG